ncbi:hypothetical protein HD597_006786 [Nonomuraea thailandensis]|uniref:Uncharacterized protein n=1 Tax=Nonomuraea thailandensis TaxID=1188745 RepID=A0A9X2GJ07_9ACTN|nr:hypothetical protein [Nonomuraea thailandensis]MCP2359766.1 hypothetical protein [Nonomuraea thailandensis]
MTSEQAEARTLTDWRGNPYTVGTTVFYPRMSDRSCEIQEGVVIDIWDAVYEYGKWRWVRFDPANPKHQAEAAKPDGRIVTKVKVQPTGLGSRNFGRADSTLVQDEQGRLVHDELGRPVYEVGELKPAVIEIIQNITVATCTHRDG